MVSEAETNRTTVWGSFAEANAFAEVVDLARPFPFAFVLAREAADFDDGAEPALNISRFAHRIALSLSRWNQPTVRGPRRPGCLEYSSQVM